MNDEYQIRALFMPKPIKGETKDEYLQRCMSDNEMQKYSKDQRYLLCNVYWKEVKLESYTDYPQAATDNAKIALRWAEKNGWGDCLEATGKARANQLANREPISEDTISRMASFERHRQNSKKELGDGCGRLAWLSWGGDEGIEWSKRKLKEIRNEN